MFRKKDKKTEEEATTVEQEDFAFEADKTPTEEAVPVENSAEEQPTEEQAAEQPTEEQSAEEVVALEPDHDIENTPLTKIEDERKTFLKSYKKQSVIKMVIGALGIAIIAFGFLVVPSLLQDNKAAQISLMAVCAVVSIAGMFSYNFIAKKQTNKRMNHYFGTYYNSLAEYVLDSEELKDVDCQADRKLTPDQFKNNKLWKDVEVVGSRAVTTFKYHDKEILLADAAGQIKENKRMKPIFVGKYFIVPCSYKNENPIVVYLKGDKRSIPPTDVEDMKCVLDEKNIAVYSNNTQWSKFITKSVRETLMKLNTRNDLIDVSISIQSGIAYICLGYDDALMVLPLDKELNARPVKKFKVDFASTLEIIDVLNK